MKITIAAIGLLKRGPEWNLLEMYRTRLPWKLEVLQHEVKSPPQDVETLKAKEAEWLLEAVKNCHFSMAMDERGKRFTSPAFAEHLRTLALHGNRHVGFVLGGAHGLHESVRKQADVTLSLSDMTLPHMLARVMLVEQLYRAYTITTNHPYHK